jgi:hypothetical protein
MAEKPKVLYRVLIATMSQGDPKATWECWSTWDDQRAAYAAMAEYREEWGPKDFTPIRIVKLINADKFGNSRDETFIDETGTDIIEWARMINAGEIVSEER